MKKPFTLCAAGICGALASWPAMAREAEDAHVNQAQCYYVSDVQLARDAQNGFMNFVMIDGQRIPFTGKNHDRPPADTHLAWYGFGKQPVEIRWIFNKPAYRDMMERNGTPLKVRSVMVEPMHAAAVLRPAGAAVSRNQLRGLSS